MGRRARIKTAWAGGVPWTQALEHAAGRDPLALALKSGNFGSEDFFLKAWERLP